jgi:hypothetical protein
MKIDVKDRGRLPLDTKSARVGKKVVNMSIDQAGGQYWLKPVNTGQYWSIENSLVSVGFFWSF